MADRAVDCSEPRARRGNGRVGAIVGDRARNSRYRGTFSAPVSLDIRIRTHASRTRQRTASDDNVENRANLAARAATNFQIFHRRISCARNVIVDCDSPPLPAESYFS